MVTRHRNTITSPSPEPRAGWPVASVQYSPLGLISKYEMSPLSPRTSSYFDHNSENTIMDNFEFIIQFYTLFPPSLGSGMMTLTSGCGERGKVRGASEHRSGGEEWGIMTSFITNGMSMEHETWRLNHRGSILNYNCYAGLGCQKEWDIDTTLDTPPPTL